MQHLTDDEFHRFQRFIFREAGITLGQTKKALVAGRLAKRVEAHSLGSFSAYLSLIGNPAHGPEAQLAIDLLTTNETYFFREQKHFDLLRERAVRAAAERREYRVWSAASSTGEEAYSAAMVLADCFGLDSGAWSVLGTDISARVLVRARRGHYSVARTNLIPPASLQRYCLKGVGKQEGTLLIDPRLRAHVEFSQVNLNRPLPEMPPFDVIFLRNVMIYFNAETKREVIGRLVPKLKRDGVLFVGHSESLNGVSDELVALAPATYARAAPR